MQGPPFDKHVRGDSRTDVGTINRASIASKCHSTGEGLSPPRVRDCETKPRITPGKNDHFFPSRPGRLNI